MTGVALGLLAVPLDGDICQENTVCAVWGGGIEVLALSAQINKLCGDAFENAQSGLLVRAASIARRSDN